MKVLLEFDKDKDKDELIHIYTKAPKFQKALYDIWEYVCKIANNEYDEHSEYEMRVAEDIKAKIEQVANRWEVENEMHWVDYEIGLE